jgi:N-acetylmuramoyl-L-alanine amidase
MGRNYAVLREPHAVAVVIEPLFLSDPAAATAARAPLHADQAATAIVGGLRDYLGRVPLGDGSAGP